MLFPPGNHRISCLKSIYDVASIFWCLNMWPFSATDKLQIKLREEGGIRALLGMVRSRHPDVLAQVARGIANFAKCESRGAAQGNNIIFLICGKFYLF